MRLQKGVIHALALLLGIGIIFLIVLFSKRAGVLGIATTVSASSTSISASPNPCTLSAPKTTCSTTISWTLSQGQTADICVSANGGSEALFASVGKAGSKSAPWIYDSAKYTFNLKMPSGRFWIFGGTKCQGTVASSVNVTTYYNNPNSPLDIQVFANVKNSTGYSCGYDNPKLAGAVFQVRKDGDTKVLDTKTSGSDGKLTFNLPSGTYYFKNTIAPSGFNTYGSEFKYTLPRPASNVPLAICLTRQSDVPSLYPITVKVILDDRAHNIWTGYQGATVGLYREGTDAALSQLTTNSSGDAAFPSQVVGKYRLQLSVPNGYKVRQVSGQDSSSNIDSFDLNNSGTTAHNGSFVIVPQ